MAVPVGERAALIVTEPPLRVNFNAFEMRLVNTWRSFTLSPTMAGTSGSTVSTSVSPALCAMRRNEDADALRNSARSISRASSVHLQLWILEMSRMLLMTASR
jgi:hypothetical protein